MFAVSFLAVATLTNLLGRQMRASQALADRRGAEVGQPRRGQRTDHPPHAHRRAAGRQRQPHPPGQRGGDAAAGRRRRRPPPRPGRAGTRAAACTAGAATACSTRPRCGWPPTCPEVLPRFTRLLADSDQSLVFLDDTSQLSRRAESMTLATLGRFSASLAHEIRNPLAAISYATQLLEESRAIPEADRRMLRDHPPADPAHERHRRERAVAGPARARAARAHRAGRASPASSSRNTAAAIRWKATPCRSPRSSRRCRRWPTPRHLHQVLTALVHNALTYGRLPGRAGAGDACACSDEHGPQIDVVDRGPGIPDARRGAVVPAVLHHLRPRHRAGPVHRPRAVPRQPGHARIRPGARRRQLFPHPPAGAAFTAAGVTAPHGYVRPTGASRVPSVWRPPGRRAKVRG